MRNFAFLFALVGCYQPVLVEPTTPELVSTFQLTVTGETEDSEARERPDFGESDFRDVTLTIQAFAPNGDESDLDFNALITPSAPCVDLEDTGTGEHGMEISVPLIAGAAEVPLRLHHIPGPLEVWVTAGSRAEGGFAASISDTLNYRKPTVAGLQALPVERCSGLEGRELSNCQRNRIAHAALEGCAVDLETGDGLVVTRVAGDGFNVTERGRPVRDNSLFVYTYNAPDEVFVGAIVDHLEGNATEFMGGTQLADASYTLRRDEDGVAVGVSLEQLGEEFPATELTAALLNRSPSGAQRCRRIDRDIPLNIAMERLEGGPVFLAGAEVAYEPDDYSLSSYLQYGQFNIALGQGDGSRCISLLARNARPDFDPRLPGCSGQSIPYVEGTLRGLFFEGSSTPTWVVEAYHLAMEPPSPCLLESP